MSCRVPKIYEDQLKKKRSLHYLKTAQQASLENNYTVAYENFVKYFESLKCPYKSSPDDQKTFIEIVCKIGTFLEETLDAEELLKCYLKALNLFPDNSILLNKLGAYFFKVKETEIAKNFLEKSLKMDNNCLPAERNLTHVKWLQMPRWHFRMLNDIRRNTAYDKAITDTISKGYNSVVDVGSGCGLLSLFASRDPNTKVDAIEENKTLAKMSVKVYEENDVKNVSVVNVNSSELAGPLDKCNLVITEIFDVAFFGERALETIIHAVTVLRTERDYKIIPCGAKLYVTGIFSPQIHSKTWLKPNSQQILQLYNICVKKIRSEPYEGVDLTEVGLEYLTNTAEFFRMYFYDIGRIEEMLDGYQEVIHLRCKAGIIQAVAVWFDLNLTEEISITTNPFDENRVRCWEQAIFPLDHPMIVNDNDIITLQARLYDCKLSFSLPQVPIYRHDCFHVSKELISFMNDQNLIACIFKLAEKFNKPNLTIVDYCVFPLFGFLMAKNNNTIYHPVTKDDDIEFFYHMLTVYQIPADQFILLEQRLAETPDISADQPSIYFFEPLNIDGSIENILHEKREEMETSETIVIPQSVKVNVQLIHSAYIDHCNKVNDENVLGFKIAKFMNEYTGDEHPNLEAMKYIEYSVPVKFLLDGDGRKSCDIVVNRSGVINVLLFWYDVQFYEDIILNTLNSSHYKKSCYFLDQPKTVEVGETFQVVMQTEGSYLKLYLE